jgi:hypothetical protein
MPQLSWRGVNIQPADAGPPSFREQHLPEYRVRLLDVYAACAGWPHAAITPLWPLVTLASEAFEHENLEAWRGTLTELETRVAAVPANPASNPPGGAEMAAQAQGGASVGAQHE